MTFVKGGEGHQQNFVGAVVEDKKRGKPPNLFLLIKEEREKTKEVKGGWSESKEVKYEKVVYEEKEGVDGSPNVRL